MSSSARLLILSCAAALAACNDPPTVPAPATLEVVQAPGSVGAPGFPLIDTIRVRLVDEAGQGVAGGRVTWAVREGGGSVYPLADSADAEGLVAAIWTLGSRPGANELRVSEVGGAAVTFKATGDVFRATKVVSDGWSIGCGLVQGSVWCWGGGSPVRGAATSSYNAAEPSDEFRILFLNSAPALLSDERTYTEVAVSWSTLCALELGGTLWCSKWQDKLPLTEVVGLPPLLEGSLVGSDFGVCALAASDHRPWCALNDSPPAVVPGSPPFTRLAMGSWVDDYTCGLLADSSAMCWGSGPLGDGSSAPSSTPVTVSGGHRFVDLVAGNRFGCGRTPAGDVWCWGTGGGVTYLTPTHVASGVTLLGAGNDWIQLGQPGGRVLRDFGPGLTGAPSWATTLSGLDDLPVARLAENDATGCVVGAGDEVYCILNMWDTSTMILINIYVPVQPVRPE